MWCFIEFINSTGVSLYDGYIKCDEEYLEKKEVERDVSSAVTTLIPCLPKLRTAANALLTRA